MNLIKQCLFIAAVIYTSFSDKPFCETFPATGPADQVPELPDRFTTRIERNYDGDFSVDMLMSFDFTNRKAALISQQDNIETRLIFNYETDEIYMIDFWANETNHVNYPGELDHLRFMGCNTFQLSKTPDLNEYFGANLDGSLLIPNSVYKVLNFGDAPMEYLGIEYVRGSNESLGILCEVWRSCEFNAQEKTNFTIKTYMSKQPQSMPFPNKQFKDVLVRQIIAGVKNIDGVLEPYEEYHEYFGFKANVTVDSMFQTPSSVFCENRKISKNPPNLPNKIKYSREQIHTDTITHLRDIFYDFDFKASKYEMRPSFKDETQFGVTDPLYIIHDYNIGISFIMNKALNNCSIVPININELDSNLTFQDKHYFLIKQKSPAALFELDTEYIYTGNRKVDDISSDIFISNRKPIEKSDIYNEYAFVSEDFEFQTIDGEINQFPKSIYRTSKQNLNFQEFENYYGFETGSRDVSVYDTSSCFARTEIITIRITFPYAGLIDKKVLESEENLKTSSFLMLLEQLKVSFSRFSRPQLSVSDDGNLYLRIKILPSPPSLTFFARINNKQRYGHFKFIPNVKLSEICASYCLMTDYCKSFDFTTKYGNCYLFAQHYTEGNIHDGYDAYDHYSKNTDETFYSGDSPQLLNRIEKYISKEMLKLPVGGIESGVRLSASKVIEVSDSDSRQGTTSLLKNYNRVKPNNKFDDLQTVHYEDVSVDQCAKYCNEALKFECTAFSYCYINGVCVLSGNFVENSNFTSDATCDVYEKSALYHYTEFSAKTYIKETDLAYKKVGSANDCARKCDQETNLHCRSFNYCPDQKECFLSETHLVAGSQSNPATDLLCKHFSRNYLADFLFTSSNEISLKADLSYEGIPAEECAKLCESAEGFSCSSFDYCQDKQICLLNKGLAKNSKFVDQSSPKAICKNFKREFFFLTSVVKNNHDNSKTVLAVLSILFAAVGIAAGVVGTLFYLKRK